MLVISKDRSILIKGVAIIMMVFLHLFNLNHTQLCSNLLYVGNDPFSKWLSYACGPVDFFLLLSGYGLAYTYDHKGLGFIQQAKRILKLYIHYWLVLLVFVTLGSFMFTGRYPGGWNKLLMNVVGWETTYNAEMWFLFPYCIICITSPMLFYFFVRNRITYALMLAAGLRIIGYYLVSKYGIAYIYDSVIIYQFMLCVELIYPFTVGAVFYRTNFRLNTILPSWLTLFLISILVVLVATFNHITIYMLYVPVIVFLLCQLSYPRWLEVLLVELGRKSMPIWMIHTWYCYYLFQPLIYSLKYPVLILGGTILVSYITAIPIMLLARKICVLIRIQ